MISAKVDIERFPELTEAGDNVLNHSYVNTMFGSLGISDIDRDGGYSDGVREAVGLDFPCVSDDYSSERNNSEYNLVDTSFIACMGIKVDNAIKEVIFEKREGVSRVQHALQDIGNGVRQEKEEVSDMLAKVIDLQESEETPRRSARLEKRRLEKENRSQAGV